MKFLNSRYAPYVVAILSFAILTLVYFKPLLNGKALAQHDIAMHKGMSKEIADYRERNHAEPLWTNSMFGGMPAYQVSTRYPGNWLGALDNAFKLWIPLPGGYLFLLFLGFYIMLLCFDVDPWLAFAGALAYGLSTYFLSILQAGHNSKANALGYLPAIIGGIVLIFKGRHALGFAVTALFTAMELNANHVQISYYGYMMIGCLILGYMIQAAMKGKIREFSNGLAIFLGASMLAVLPNMGNLMTTNEYGKLSNRGKAELTINPDLTKTKVTSGIEHEYATNWSYGIDETFSFLIPDFKGGGNRSIREADPEALKAVDPELREPVSFEDAYFGDQPSVAAPDYVGACIIFLALLGLFIIKNPIKWPVVVITILATMLGWGHNFMSLTEFFMEVVPGYNKFRAVSMIMIIPELTIPLLAILAVQEIIQMKGDEGYKFRFLKSKISLRKLVIGCAIAVGGFCLLCYMAPDMVNTFRSQRDERKILQKYVNAGYKESEIKPMIVRMMPELEKARTEIFRSDALRSLIFVALAFGILYLFMLKKIQKNVFILMVGIFVLVDLWSVDRRYLNEKSFIPKSENQDNITRKSPADEEILKDTDPNYRVLNLSLGPFDDASTSYYHKSIGGYHGAKLRRYVDLIEFHLYPEIQEMYRDLSKTSPNDSSMGRLMENLGVLNMLNTRYFIMQAGERPTDVVPLKNTRANGNGWFVSRLIKVSSPDSEIVTLGRLNTKTEAVLNEKFFAEQSLKENYDGTGSVKLVSYEPNILKYETNNSTAGFAVFSEIYYKNGWNAYVDGQLKPHAQVNYVLRGMELPAGKHEVEFRFEPQIYKTGNTIALIGSVLLLAVVGYLFWKSLRTMLLLVNQGKTKQPVK